MIYAEHPFILHSCDKLILSIRASSILSLIVLFGSVGVMFNNCSHQYPIERIEVESVILQLVQFLSVGNSLSREI